MSTQTQQPTDAPVQARVLEISGLPLSQIEAYARDTSDVYLERRGARTFLVADR